MTAQADILAHADRWCGAMLTIPGESIQPIVAFAESCCGAIRVRGEWRWLEIPSLAWVEGNPATDDTLTIRSPRGIVCVLERKP